MSERHYLSGKVTHRSLPVVENASGPEAPEIKRLLLPQGELAQIHNAEEPIRYLAVIELRSGGTRGNHYHKAKQEHVYLIEGEVTVLLEDLATGAREDFQMRAGDLIHIPPGIAHALRTIHPGRAIEFAPARLDPGDTFRHPIAG